jgi:hypothetical protein
MSVFKKMFTPSRPKPVQDWSGSRPSHVIIDQLKFLLSQAPMMDASQFFNDFSRLQASRAPYAYVHPSTFAQMTNGRVPTGSDTIPRSPTRWIVSTLMPVGLILFSPNAMPFTGKIKAA